MFCPRKTGPTILQLYLIFKCYFCATIFWEQHLITFFYSNRYNIATLGKYKLRPKLWSVENVSLAVRIWEHCKMLIDCNSQGQQISILQAKEFVCKIYPLTKTMLEVNTKRKHTGNYAQGEPSFPEYNMDKGNCIKESNLRGCKL